MHGVLASNLISSMLECSRENEMDSKDEFSPPIDASGILKQDFKTSGTNRSFYLTLARYFSSLYSVCLSLDLFQKTIID